MYGFHINVKFQSNKSYNGLQELLPCFSHKNLNDYFHDIDHHNAVMSDKNYETENQDFKSNQDSPPPKGTEINECVKRKQWWFTEPRKQWWFTEHTVIHPNQHSCPDNLLPMVYKVANPLSRPMCNSATFTRICYGKLYMQYVQLISLSYFKCAMGTVAIRWFSDLNLSQKRKIQYFREFKTWDLLSELKFHSVVQKIRHGSGW